MGLLSYSFVTVTLLADLGLPWHFYQLGMQAPEHSAMFEVSWCVGLYVTILLFEFLPVPLERWGFTQAMDAWRNWSGVYVAFAVTLFVFMLSRNLALRGARRRWSSGRWPGSSAARGEKLRADHARDRGRHALHDAPELARLALPADAEQARAAVVVAGPAGLLLPVLDRRRHRAHRSSSRCGSRRAGTARCQMPQLAAMGQITFWSLLVYLVVPRSATWRSAAGSRARSRDGSALALRGRDRARRHPAARPALEQRCGARPDMLFGALSSPCSAWS